MTEIKNKKFGLTPCNKYKPRGLVRQTFNLKKYNRPHNKNNSSPFDKLNDTDDLDAGIIFYKNDTYLDKNGKTYKGKKVHFIKKFNKNIKTNDLILTKKELINYQQGSKITLKIMNKDKENYSFIRADKLIKVINGENTKININNLDTDDLKGVLSTLSELINTKTTGKDTVKNKKYLSRICMTGVVPVFHEWKENRGDGHELLDKKREQYVITYPAWPNFENCRKGELKGLSDQEVRLKNKEKLNKQWEILGIDIKKEPDPTIISKTKIECYKQYIKQVIELQIQAIKFDGKNQLSITFPSAFLKGLGQEGKDKLLKAFNEGIKEATEKHDDMRFFISNAPKDFNTYGKKNIYNVSGLDAAELNRSKRARKIITKEKIDIAYNVTPHDLTEVGNGCFGDGASGAGDEAFARMAPMVIGVMGCSRNINLQKIGLSANKAVIKLAAKNIVKNRQYKTPKEINQNISQNNNQQKKIKNKQNKQVNEINQNIDQQQNLNQQNNNNNQLEDPDFLEKKMIEKEKYINKNKDKTLLEVLKNSVNYYNNKLASLKSLRNKIIIKNPNNCIDDINNLINGTKETLNLDSTLAIMLEKVKDKNIHIMNNKKFCKTVLQEIRIDSKNMVQAGFGGKISYDIKNKKAILSFLDNSFLMNKLDIIDDIPEMQDIKSILRSGINIDINDKIKENELFVIFGKFKTNPAIAFIELLNNPNINLTTNDGKKIQNDDEITEKLSNCLIIVTESRKQIAKISKFREEIKTNNKDIATFVEIISEITMKSLMNKELEKKLIGEGKSFKDINILAEQVIVLLDNIKNNKIVLSQDNINDLLSKDQDKQINGFLHCIDLSLNEQLKKASNNIGDKIKQNNDIKIL